MNRKMERLIVTKRWSTPHVLRAIKLAFIRRHARDPEALRRSTRQESTQMIRFRYLLTIGDIAEGSKNHERRKVRSQ